MARTLFTFGLEDGNNVIRDHRGELFAKVGTRAQVKAILFSQLKPIYGWKDIKEVDLKTFERDEATATIVTAPQDGPFKRKTKWYVRFEGKELEQAYDSQEEAQDAYNSIE